LDLRWTGKAGFLDQGDFVTPRYLQNLRTEMGLLVSPELKQICDFTGILNESWQEIEEMKYHSPIEWIDPVARLITAVDAIEESEFIALKCGLIGDLEDLIEGLNEARENELLFCLCLE
jgi:hypothetical protein